MARAIGGVNFDIMHGRVGALKNVVDMYVNAGQIGPGAQLLGTLDGAFTLRTVKFSASPGTFIASCEALQGTSVTVVDALGTTGTCIVNMVDVTSGNGGEGAAKAVITNGASTYRCEVIFTLTRVNA